MSIHENMIVKKGLKNKAVFGPIVPVVFFVSGLFSLLSMAPTAVLAQSVTPPSSSVTPIPTTISEIGTSTITSLLTAPTSSPIIMDVHAVRTWQSLGGIRKTLKQGSKGAEVALLQELLLNYSKIFSSVEPTGNFGPQTRSALKDFQRKMNLPQTGIVDVKTRNIINAIYFQDVCPDTPWNPDSDKSLKNVSRNESVGLSYEPGDLLRIPPTIKTAGIMCLRNDVIPRIREMFIDAEESGHILMVTSAFRRPEIQTSLYKFWVDLSGEDAKRGIAEAGHSEHQLGTTVDLTAKSVGYSGVSERLGKTKDGIWLKENSYKYGFIMSYPEGKEAITGYRYEPWHFRYVGVDIAKDIHNEGLTAKEYFDLYSPGN